MKNLNLEKNSSKELSSEELANIEGGIIPYIALGLAAGTFTLALGYYSGKAAYYLSN